MPTAKSVFMHLVCPVLLAAAPDAPPPARADEAPAPEAGPARRLLGRYHGFEPGVAADPKGHVLIAAIDYREDQSKKQARTPMYLITWRSGDRGATWDDPRPVGDEQMGDVWLQTDPRGGFLAAHMQGNRTMRAVFRRTDDEGRTWTGERVLGSWVDKTVLAVSPSGDRLAVAFLAAGKRQPAVLRSADRGDHWEAVPRDGPREWSYFPNGLGVTDGGAVVAAWALKERGFESPHSPDHKSARVKLVVSTTKDAGKTWKDLELAGYTPSQLEPDTPGARSGLGCGPGVVVALGGSGAAHAVYAYPAGDKRDYRLVYRRSADLQTWTDPVPLSAGNADDFRGFPAVAAAGDRVHVAWMERRAGVFNVWYRGSADGGKNWSKPVRLSSPDKPTDLLTADGFKEPGGHYMSLAEDGTGTAHAAWGVGGGGRGGEIWHCPVRLQHEKGQAK